MFFQTLIFQRKKHPKKDDSMAPGGWTWPSGETESAYLNHWIFSWKSKTRRDQHENIKRKLPSRGMHFRVTFIISICRCLESFCFGCYLLSLDGTCCCFFNGDLMFAIICGLVRCHLLLVFAAICYHSMVLAAVVHGDSMFATTCGLVCCHSLLFFDVCCCFVLFVSICRC